LLFGQYDFCLNLGGIANVSMETEQGRAAFDISPFNLLLNHYATKLGQKYDDQGKLAESGTIIPSLLDALEALPLYHQGRRKSLGREDIEAYYSPVLYRFAAASPQNILSTLIEHFSGQISKALLEFSRATVATMLVTGGGTHNRYFIRRLSERCGDAIQIII